MSGNLTNRGVYMAGREALVDIMMYHDGTAYAVEVSATDNPYNSSWAGLQLHQRDLAEDLTAARNPTLDIGLANRLRLKSWYIDPQGKPFPVKYLVLRVVIGDTPRVAFRLLDPAQMVKEGKLTMVYEPKGTNGPWIRFTPAQATAPDYLAVLLAGLTLQRMPSEASSSSTTFNPFLQS